MIIGSLRITENIIYRIFCVQLIINFAAITFIGQLQLILQIVKAIINGSSRKHQHLCLHALTNNLVHQHRIAILFIFAIKGTAITEIMRFINNYKVIVAPIYPA